MTEFAIAFYPDFYGLVWVNENGRIVVCPLFEDKKNAQDATKTVEAWNEKRTIATFIERPNGDYSFIFYQNPKFSFEKGNMAFYRSTMQQSGHYSQVREKLQSEQIYFQFLYASDVKKPDSYEEISNIIPIGTCRVINESELSNEEYYVEKYAHQISGGYDV